MPTLEITVPIGATPSAIVNLPLADIEAWELNPRKTFEQDALYQLATSIAEQGVLQNIVVRRLRPETNEGEQNFRYQIIAGERRWRASQIAKLDTIPARILSDMTSDADAFEIALRENTDRQSLAPLDEAEGYQKYLMLSHIKQEDLGARLGVSQSTISNALRLLRLPEPVRVKIREGALSKAVALELCRLSDYPEDCGEIAFSAASEGFTQRQVAQLVGARLGTIQKAEKERQASLPLPLDDVPTAPVAPATETVTVDAPDDSDPDEQPTPTVVPTEERLEDQDLEDPFADEDDEEDSNAGDAPEAEDETFEQPEETPEAGPAAPASAQPRVDAPVPATPATPPTPTPQAVVPAPATTAAPTETVIAPAGPMIAASISQATDDWLFEQDLTLDKALTELQTYRLTPLAKLALKALYDHFISGLPEGSDVDTSAHLEAVICTRARQVGVMPETGLDND